MNTNDQQRLNESIQRLNEAYSAGYNRALNESVPPVEYEQSPVTPTGEPDFDQMTPAQQQEYDNYQKQLEQEQKEREDQKKRRDLRWWLEYREKKLRPDPRYTPAGPRPTQGWGEDYWDYQKRLRAWQRQHGYERY